MKALAIISALFAVKAVYACADGDEHTHHHHRRSSQPNIAITPPTRPLEWGDLNIIHTTDSHGWLLGHQKTSFPEPNYSGDFGDFASFVAQMKEIALKRDVDLLLVDSGDLHDGTGLVDGFPPGGVDAHDANKFFLQLPYDLATIGNHELYIYNNTLDMYHNFVPKLNGRYLSSNVNITLPGTNHSAPVGNRYVKFKTRKGRRVTSLGVLYDFTGNDVGTTVQKVEDMVNEQWFSEAIAEEPDLFLLIGHMPVARDSWPLVFNAIRKVHQFTPILILGGHTHIRDCLQLDGRSISLESGRYMETVGWLTANLDDGKGHNRDNHKNLTFTRRYLDPNRVTYEFHTGKKFDFDTKQGLSISSGLNALAKAFDLSFLFGTAPHDFTISQAPYPSEDSLLSLFIGDAIPYALTVNNSRANNPNFFITNTGSMRFDVYAGNFTKNDQLTASPFTDAFLYIPEVPLGVTQQVLAALNNQGAENRRSLDELERRDAVMYERGYVDKSYRSWLEEMERRSSLERRTAQNLTIGYVTHDACPGVGDDTLHTPLQSFPLPDFIGSNPPNVTDDTPIDFVFVDFIEDQLLEILNTVQSNKVYAASDIQSYTTVLADAALGIFAQHAWN